MRPPISILTVIPSLTVIESLAGFAERICTRRKAEIMAGEESCWRCFWHRKPVSLEVLVGAFIEAATLKADIASGATLQMLAGGDVGGLEYDCVQTLVKQEAFCKSGKLAEQWSLALHNKPFPFIELMLNAVTGIAYDGGNWVHRHLQFCKDILIQEPNVVIWNWFTSGFFSDYGHGTDEYWGERETLRISLSRGMLTSDSRTAQVRSRNGHSKPDTLGFTQNGGEIIALLDTRECLAEFERSAKGETP